MKPQGGPMTGGAYDIHTYEAELARKLLSQKEEPAAITRKTYHRHQEWRAGVLLHQRESCSQMTGRSRLRERTQEISYETSENIHHLCWSCLRTRSRTHISLLSRSLLKELVDRYSYEGPAASALAEKLDSIAGTRLAETVASANPLPRTRSVSAAVALMASRKSAERTLEQLKKLVPHMALDGTLDAALDEAALGEAALGEDISRKISSWWETLPAGDIQRAIEEAHENPSPKKPPHKTRSTDDGRAEDPGQAAAETSSEAAEHTDRAEHLYRSLRGIWCGTVEHLARQQARQRQEYMAEAKADKSVYEILTADLDDGTWSEEHEDKIPRHLLVPVHVEETLWGDKLTVWRAAREVADLLEAASVTVAKVPLRRKGDPKPSETTQAALRLADEGYSLCEAAELAAAALQSNTPT